MDAIRAAGASWWPLAMARELDDAILNLRTNELDIGLWIVKTSGNPEAVLEVDRQLCEHRSNWFVREVINMVRRTLARLEVSSRSIYALIEEGSCFAGTLMELALAADRVYMLSIPDKPDATFIALSEMNFGPYESVSEHSRVEFAILRRRGIGGEGQGDDRQDNQRGGGVQPRLGHRHARRSGLGR